MKYVSTKTFITSLFVMMPLLFLDVCYSDSLFANKMAGKVIDILEEDTTTAVKFDVRVSKYSGGKITPNMTLRSGDRYNIQFTPSKDCYVYIFQFDSKGQLSPLIKQSGKFNRHVRGGSTYLFPPKGQVIELDNNPGDEHIHILALTKESDTLEDEYRQAINKDNGRAMSEAIGTVSFMAGNIVTLNEGSRKRNTTVKCKGNCIYGLSFKHR